MISALTKVWEQPPHLPGIERLLRFVVDKAATVGADVLLTLQDTAVVTRVETVAINLRRILVVARGVAYPKLGRLGCHSTEDQHGLMISTTHSKRVVLIAMFTSINTQAVCADVRNAGFSTGDDVM